MGKIVPHQNKNRAFWEIDKNRFYRDKITFFCEKLRTYRYNFKTVKTLFVDSQKAYFSFDAALFFPYF